MASAKIINITTANLFFIAHASSGNREIECTVCLFPINDFVKQFVVDTLTAETNNPTTCGGSNETFRAFNYCNRAVWTCRSQGCCARLFATISKKGCAQGGRVVVHGGYDSSSVRWASRYDGRLVRWLERGSFQRHH